MPISSAMVSVPHEVLVELFRSRTALAVELLRDAFLGVGYAGFWRIWHPALRNARRTDAFEQFVRDLGLVELWRHTGRWGDYCRPGGAGDLECI